MMRLGPMIEKVVHFVLLVDQDSPAIIMRFHFESSKSVRRGRKER